MNAGDVLIPPEEIDTACGMSPMYGPGQVTLRASYAAARYGVLASIPFTLRVGQRSDTLRALYLHSGVHSAAYLTACNPRSRRMGKAWNRAAMRRLLAHLQRCHRRCIPGRAEDPVGIWPIEDSVLVLGIGRDEAVALAWQFGQNALLLMAADAIPRVHWLRPLPQAPVGSTPSRR